MFKSFSVLVLFSILFAPQWSVAQGAASSTPASVELPEIDVEIVDVEDPKAKKALENQMAAQIIHNSHEIIEGDETGDRFKDWIEAMRFGKKAVEGYRYISSSKNTDYQGIVLDSVLLFGLSHSLETASGPILVGMGVSHGWPEWLIAALGTGGAIISVPGLDPLCFAVFGLYAAQPTFRKMIRGLRVGIVRTVKGAMTITGAEALLKKIFQRPNYQQWLTEMDYVRRVREYKDGRIVANYSYPNSRSPLVKIEVEVEKDGRPFIREMTVAKRFPIKDAEAANKWIKTWGWNPANFMNKTALAQLNMAEPTERPYMEEITETARYRTYRMKSSAISFGPHSVVNPAIKASMSLPSYSMSGNNRCWGIFQLTRAQKNLRDQGLY